MISLVHEALAFWVNSHSPSARGVELVHLQKENHAAAPETESS